MVTLKQLMQHVVREGLIKIIPEHFEKIYFHWIDNLRDWCLSRQIWYGHRIPVWYDEQKNQHLPTVIEIIFARHGQSEKNAADIIAGDFNSPLTALGGKQAKELGERLKNKDIKTVVGV